MVFRIVLMTRMPVAVIHSLLNLTSAEKRMRVSRKKKKHSFLI